MKDYLHTILQWIDYNRYKVLGVVLAIAITGWLYGCEPKETSLIDPGKQVTYEQFQLEVVAETTGLNKKLADYETMGVKLQEDVNAFNAVVVQTEDNFAKQYEFRQKVIEFTGGIVTSALSGNPINIADTVATGITLLALLGGTGAYADKRRTDVVLKNLKQPTTTT